MELVGLVEKSGTYENTPYHNLMLHCVSDADGNKSVGLLTEVIKVKVSRLTECFGKPTDVHDVSCMLGKKLSFNYDKFGGVNQIRIIETLKNEQKEEVS